MLVLLLAFGQGICFLRALWHQLEGVAVVVVEVVMVGYVSVGVVAAEPQWGYTGTHGRTLDVVVSRPICGVRLWLVACRRDGRRGEKREKESCPGALGNTRDAEFAGCCSADNFCACMPRDITYGDIYWACWVRLGEGVVNLVRVAYIQPTT